MTINVPYDAIAPTFDRRYEQNDYQGVQQAVTSFVGSAPSPSTLEVGCGTGHWLKRLSSRLGMVIGVDLSLAMLERAQAAGPCALLARARAETLPFGADAFDRIICVNALHHFAEPIKFIREARRVLRPGGGLLVVGLDPHRGIDRWWIYDYFPEAHDADRERYPAANSIRMMMTEAGFSDCATQQVQHLPAELPFRVAVSRGLLERTSTSQLMVIEQQAYQRGLEALEKAQAELGERDLILRADLRLYGTVAWLQPSAKTSAHFSGKRDALTPEARVAKLDSPPASTA